jgi:hypothetical protein
VIMMLITGFLVSYLFVARMAGSYQEHDLRWMASKRVFHWERFISYGSCGLDVCSSGIDFSSADSAPGESA